MPHVLLAACSNDSMSFILLEKKKQPIILTLEGGHIQLAYSETPNASRPGK
jgi:hypothetical protein